MNTLNIIGCGHVGKTLAYLWNKNNSFSIQNILTRSIESAEKAVNFIGTGEAINHLEMMRPADVYLIATPDDHIINSCHALLGSNLLKAGDIIFHCSGSLASTTLSEILDQNIYVASIHPVKSFADPSLAINDFQGTFCGIEGDEPALEILLPTFESIGAEIFNIDAEHKTEYHAANVFVCNYITALLALGTKVYSQAGVSKDIAMKVIEPLVRETIDNNFKLGSVKALTGPIARGDYELVKRQINSLSASPDVADLYKSLGRVALDLSHEQGTASKESIQNLRLLLQES